MIPARLVGGVFAVMGVLSCAEGHPLAPETRAGREVASWPTWVLSRPDEVRPAAPPGSGTASAAAELTEVIQRQAARGAREDSLLRAWDGDPTSSWTRVAVERLDFYWPLLPDVRLVTPPRAARIMGLLHVAMHDAIVATWDAKYTWRREAPATRDPRIRRLVSVDTLPSYPSEHAAMAAVTHAILAYALPLDDSLAMRQRAREAAESRLVAGAATRSDIEAGWALGIAVAQRVIARARLDGADAVWDGARPAVDLPWVPTPPRRVAVPFEPMAGRWRPWVIADGSTFRLPAPPARTTAQFQADLAELQRLATGGRTEQQAARARYWATDAPSLRWELVVDDELRQRRWSVAHAAQARAWVSVAIQDAAIACWDSKYTWWLARPITVDPTLGTVFSTPPFPSYPSGHSTMSTAAAVVMEALFPDASARYHALAEEASFSRVWGGVHYRFDVVDGDSLGARVGRAIADRMRATVRR